MQPGGSKQEDVTQTKRKYQARDDEDEEQDAEFESKKSKMHSLDSDEEDEHAAEKEKYNVAEAESQMFDGQEKATIDYDGDIKITAFNMEEEMQEGHFDKQGTFIFKKDRDLVQDSWLDNIDWVKVKEGEEKKDLKPKGLADSDSEDETPTVDIKGIYSKMIEFMKPGENILKCIKRLGGQQGKNKRDKKQKLDSEQQQILDNMVGYANEILSTGDMDIYQRTYEQMKLALAPKKEAEMDMFGDDLPEAKSEPSTSKKVEEVDERIMWEYKWEDKEGSEVFGPYSSEDMLAWTQEGYFGNGVFVRKQSEPTFHSSKRIDFDLYVE